MTKTLLVFLFTTLLTGVVIAQPSINNFTPSSGPLLSSVTITGTGFSNTPANNIVYFGPVKATVTAASASQLTVIVPKGATYHPISVTVDGLTTYSNKPFIVSFADGGTIHPNSFEVVAVADSAGGGTTDIRYGDIDGDGKSDAVVVNPQNNTFSVYRNTSSGNTISFGSRVDFTTSGYPYHLTLGDLDSDGKLDVVVSNNDSNSVSIFRNTSSPATITMAARKDFSTAVQPSSVTITDFDADGKPDIAVACMDLAGSVSLLRNTSTIGTLSFASVVNFSAGSPVDNIVAGDLNNDNKPDIALTSFAVNRIYILKNNSSTGSVSFTAGNYISVGSHPSGLAIADLDGDGKSELITSLFYGGFITILKNASGANISFVGSTIIPTGKGPIDLAIGDLDGDAKPDIAVLNSFESISVIKNNSTPGNISMGAKVDFPGDLLTLRIAIADLDGDGRPEISNLTYAFRVLVWKNKVGAPYISGFTPVNGVKGTVVTITGSALQRVTDVSFGGTPASSFSVINNTSVTATVGSGTTGGVTLTNLYGSHTVDGFTYYHLPTVTNFSPLSAATTDTVTITGTNFTNVSSVRFGGTPSPFFKVINTTTITAVVGNGSSGSIEVTTPGGIGSLPGFTYLPPPQVTSFTPASAGRNTTVTLSGFNFTNVTSVSFGEAPALSFTVSSPTKIVAQVGGGATGNVTVTSSYGKGSLSGFTYLAEQPPSITQITPLNAPVGATVTIKGERFGSTISDNEVRFGGARALITSASTTSITCTVPFGSMLHPVTVLNLATGLRAVSERSFQSTFPGGSPYQFDPEIRLPAGSENMNPTSTCLEDLDGDGQLEVIIANEGNPGSITVYRKNGTSATPDFNRTDFGPVPPARDVTTADLDGDGLPEIISVTHYISGILSVLRNTSTPGNLSFAAPIQFPVTVLANKIIVADIDGDGRADIITDGNAKFCVLRNTSIPGHVSFAAKTETPIWTFGVSLAVADFDGDKKADVALLHGLNDNNRLTIFRNTTTGTAISFTEAGIIPTCLSPSDIYAADFDGDGKADLALSCYDQMVLAVHRNTGVPGTISFASKIDVPINLNSRAIQSKIMANDIDGDGKPDLLVILYVPYVYRTVNIFSNHSTPGTLHFQNKGFVSVSGPKWGMAIGDLNNDSKADIAVANSFDRQVSIIKNRITTVERDTICSGAGTSFSTRLAGSTYQWQVLDNGYQTLTSNGNYSGVTTSVLQIKNALGSMDGKIYRVIVDGKPADVKQLFVDATPTPVITATPALRCAGSTATLTVASPGCNTCTYAWNGAAPSQTPFLTITTGGTYSVAVSNMCGSATATQTVPFTQPVTPTIQITASTCSYNGDISFSSAVTHQGSTGKIGWYKNDIFVGYDSSYIERSVVPGTKIYAKLISSVACANPQTVTSNTITASCNLVTALPNIDNVESLVVSPNPASSRLTIKIKLMKAAQVRYEFQDAFGRPVIPAIDKRLNGTAITTMDLRSLANGLYYLRTTVKGKSMLQKVIIVN